MKVPKALQPLVEDGVIEEVIRPLMMGKEAAVYVVYAHGQVCCAKVYKDASHRSFRNRVAYQEGRKVRNSRKSRAMQRGSKYGKQELEEGWQNAEVDALYRLAAAGVRVPKPLDFSGGVLLMELLIDAAGHVAPRLNDLALTPETARAYHTLLMRDVVKMLCAGLIHGDLSEYNVLVDADGPVIIDLPQAVDAAGNNSAPKMLQRDVDNLAAYFAQFAPELGTTDYGREIWALYEKGELQPDTELTGRFQQSTRKADIGSVLSDIDDARRDAERRMPKAPSKPKKDEAWRGVVPDAEPGEAPRGAAVGGGPAQAAPTETERFVSATGARKVVDLKPRRTPPPPPAPEPEPAKKKRRRRRRRGGAGGEGGQDNASQSPGNQNQGGRAQGGGNQGGRAQGGGNQGGRGQGGGNQDGRGQGGGNQGGRGQGGRGDGRQGGRGESAGGRGDGRQGGGERRPPASNGSRPQGQSARPDNPSGSGPDGGPPKKKRRRRRKRIPDSERRPSPEGSSGGEG